MVENDFDARTHMFAFSDAVLLAGFEYDICLFMKFHFGAENTSFFVVITLLAEIPVRIVL